VTPQHIIELVPTAASIPAEIRTQIGHDVLYEMFSARQLQDPSAIAGEDLIEIPSDFPYLDLPGLSKELQLKLVRLRPGTLGAASRIEGMTPAALALLLARIRRRDRAAAQ
jgi:tRNA uridine 5-carboxymethylaminomethyl modification enzyme